MYGEAWLLVVPPLVQFGSKPALVHFALEPCCLFFARNSFLPRANARCTVRDGHILIRSALPRQPAPGTVAFPGRSRRREPTSGPWSRGAENASKVADVSEVAGR